ncbi:hypothetical protein [Trichocoleus sp. DQ-U1]|uniref:hypothetical protein n=1 Tax=Trichocoleus sp. DQ-U1 TaxID=2933926 RepID=UPI003299C546
MRRHSLSIEYTRERSLRIHLPHIKVRTDKSALRYRVLPKMPYKRSLGDEPKSCQQVVTN